MQKQQQYGAGVGSKGAAASSSSVLDLVEKLKAKLAQRGARGMIGLGKSFKIMDDNNSRSLDQSEFNKAMKEQMLNFSE